MAAPRYRSRSIIKSKVRVPTGTKVRYSYKKPKAAKCAKCGASLKGIPRERPYKIRKLAKSKKTNARPFGGNLCSKCMRKEIISRNKE